MKFNLFFIIMLSLSLSLSHFGIRRSNLGVGWRFEHKAIELRHWAIELGHWLNLAMRRPILAIEWLIWSAKWQLGYEMVHLGHGMTKFSSWVVNLAMRLPI